MSLLALFLSSQLSYASDIYSINKLASINNLIQDKQGFLWFAGQQGLTRFDGTTSITFSSSNSKWPLPFTWIHDVEQIGNKFLLATEANGLWEFNPTSGEYKAIMPEIEQKSIYDIAVFNGKYYLSFANKLYQYTPETGQAIIIKENIAILDMAHTNKNLYVSSKSGLFQLSNKTNQLTKLLKEPVNVITASSSYVIAVTQHKIYSINEQGKVISKNNPNKIYALTKALDHTHNNEYFFAAINTGQIEKISAQTLKKVKHNYPNFTATHIRKILQDSSGVLWLISNKGITQLNKNTVTNQTKFFDIPINANEIALVDEKIIIGSYGLGLQNFIAPIFNNDINKNFTKKALRISDLQNVGNDLYIGTFDGLWLYSGETKAIQKLNFPNNNRLILKLTLKNNKLYIATNYNGFYEYDLKTKKITTHIDQQNGLKSLEVIDILALDNGDIWLANTQGIDIYNKNTQSIKNIDVPGPNKVISVVNFENKIYASTLGDGIFVYNLQGELLSNFAKGIRFNYMEVINDEIWIAARPGLYRLNPANNQLTIVPNTENYSFVGSTLVHNGKIYSSHFTGILSLPLAKPEIYNAKVFISQTDISGHSQLLNKSMTIPSPNDVITLSLASLDYRKGPDKKYRYKINNGRWTPINSNQLTLTGLASGFYNIEIMATNSLGQWSNNRAFTEINVAYPWYWTPRIRLVYFIFFIGLLSFTVWLLYLRSKSISRIHKILTSDIKSKGQVALNVTYHLTQAIDSLRAGDIKNTDLLLQQSIADLTSNNIHQELNTLQGNSLTVAVDYLAEHLHKKYHVNLKSTINIDETLLPEEIQKDFYKIIYEATTSAILAASGRNFTVNLKLHRKKLWLSIQDDANSFAHFDNRINFDMAMYYIRQIAKKHQGVVNTFDENILGSQLLISVPFQASHHNYEEK